MKLTYYGHSALFAEHNGTKVIIDPFLSGNEHCDVDPDTIKVDAVILTHGHDDHVGDALSIAKRNNAPIIAVFELAMLLQQRGAEVHMMNIGGAYSFNGFEVKFTQAFHSSSLSDGDQFLYAGMPGGVLLTMGDKTIFHAGDTNLFSDMKLIGTMAKIDIAALPIGDNLTMGPSDAAIAAEWLRVKKVIPIHYNTFPFIAQDPKEYAKLLDIRNIECFPLEIGDELSI